jgi:hypothetical protein
VARCLISREDFTTAQPIRVVFEGGNLPDSFAIDLDPTTYGTGTMGWHGSGKFTAVVNGVPTQVSMDLKAFVSGSKVVPGHKMDE